MSCLTCPILTQPVVGIKLCGHGGHEASYGPQWSIPNKDFVYSRLIRSLFPGEVCLLSFCKGATPAPEIPCLPETSTVLRQAKQGNHTLVSFMSMTGKLVDLLLNGS